MLTNENYLAMFRHGAEQMMMRMTLFCVALSVMTFVGCKTADDVDDDSENVEVPGNVDNPGEETPKVVLPTGIKLLSADGIRLEAGSEAAVEFAVEPADVAFSLNPADKEVSLNCVAADGSVSEVGESANYALVNVTPVVDATTKEQKAGMYSATIADTKKSKDYNDAVTLVLSIKDEKGEMHRVSSSTFNVLYYEVPNIEHYGLPVVKIDTPNGVSIVSKEEYVTGSHVTVYDAELSLMNEADMKIKGRGNSTWDAPKKPYKMKFDEKISFFSQPKDKEWILLANYYDKTMLRTDVTFWMSAQYGKFDYIPRFTMVDMILNGEYNGIYQLGDQLKISKDRVNVGDDGFLLEIDGKAAADDVTFKATHIGQPINIKDQDVVKGDENYNYVRDYVRKADNILFASNWLDPEEGYKTLIDIDSFVEWYLVNEITKNNDASFFTSCYMNLARGGKLKMGPLWDFDISLGGYPFGRDFVNQPEDLYILDNTNWFKRMFKDPEFLAKVKERFEVYYQNREKIAEYITNRADEIYPSVLANNKKWGTICGKNTSDKMTRNYYNTQVKNLKDFITKRLEWMHTKFQSM